jgi:hypothetical protein
MAGPEGLAIFTFWVIMPTLRARLATKNTMWLTEVSWIGCGMVTIESV